MAEGSSEGEGSSRFEDVFEQEIIPQFIKMDEFIKFARVDNGLCLEEAVIQEIIENNDRKVREQKYKMLWQWVENNGSNASVERIRNLVEDYWESQADPDLGGPEDYGTTETDSVAFTEDVPAPNESALKELALKSTSRCPPEGAPVSPTKRYHHPRPAFQETKAFADTITAIESKANHNVVHVYGMSGNGKSQIVRSACKKFDVEGRRLIWHIQGSDSDFLKQELQDFTKELNVCRHVSDEQKAKVLKDLESGGVRELVEMLKLIQFPILLAVEDVTSPEDKELMRVLIQSLPVSDVGVVPANFTQVIIATRRQDAIFSVEDLANLPHYHTLKIAGFTEDEAAEFLTKSEPNVSTEKVKELSKSLAYSPLRLTLAKAYCKKYRMAYAAYFSSLGKDETIIAKEKELLENHPELGDSHGYEVIMRAVRPGVENGRERQKDEEIEYSVIQMMSFVSNSDIPDVLLGRFFQQFKPMEMDAEERCVQYLLTRLQSDCDLTIHEIKAAGDMSKVKYGEEVSSIHQDILDCVRLDMDDDSKRSVLVSVLHAMVSLVKKDNRLHQDSNLLSALMKHVDKVVNFASKMLQNSFSIEKPRQDDFEIEICLSWLYDALGFSRTIYSETQDQDDDFERALDRLWDIACSYGGRKGFICFSTKVKKDLLDYEPEKSAVKTAEKVYKQIKKASGKIPEKFVEDHYVKFCPINESAIDGMQKKIGENANIDWVKMKAEIEKNRRLNPDQVTTLRENGMLLNPKQLRKVFLSERIASVLHSRGRQVLDSKNKISLDEQKRFEWYTDLALHLTKMMGDDTGIRTTFEYIVEANNKLPRMLHTRDSESDVDFLERIKNAKLVAERLKSVCPTCYEHGVFREMSGTPYSLLNAMKYIVKANTKMYKRPDLVTKFPDLIMTDSAACLKECDRLFQLAKENVADFVVASACMVQAGKYYAAVKKYGKALEAFEASFDYNGKGINLHIERRPKLYAWAVLNTARGICEAKSDIQDVDSYRERLLKRYNLISKQNISKSWKELLDKYKKKIDELEFVQPMEVQPLVDS